jgi:MFS family permease
MLERLIKMIFPKSEKESVARFYDGNPNGFSQLPLNNKSKTEEIKEIVGLNNQNKISDLSAVFSSIFLSAIGYGILMVMMAIKLEINVKNEILMSISAITQIGAGVIFSRFLPNLGNKKTLTEIIIIGSLVSAFFSILAYFYINYLIWLLVVYALGTSFFICGVTRNTLMIDLANPNIRSLTISIGVMLVAIGNSLGPVLIKFLNSGDNFISFLLASIFYLLSIIPLLKIKNITSEIRENKNISIWRYIYNSPKIMLAGFSVSYAMSSACAFIIIYGIRVGFNESDAALLLTTLLFGTIFSIPIGYMADIFNKRLMMISSAFLSLIFSMSLFFSNSSSDIHIALFLLFAALSGVKLPALVLINEKYKPTQRLAVNSAFSKFSLIGNICGLFATGVFMRKFGSVGLWISISLILTLFLIFCFFNYLTKFKRGELKIKNFSIFNKKITESNYEI